MKNAEKIKTWLIYASLMVVILSVYSCSNNQKTKGSNDLSGESGKFYNARKEKDAQFLIAAAEMNIEEIHLGKLAQRKSRISEVKKLGKILENKHFLCLNGLSSLAMKKMILIPTAQTDMSFDTYKTLYAEPEMEFDKEYCERMINDHNNTIVMFEEASTSSSDPDIREWAASMLPELRTNLHYAVYCHNKCKNI